MILRKGKRKIVYNGMIYYWYVKNPCIYIISEDKKLHLKYGFDKEICIGPQYIEHLLYGYYSQKI